MAYMRGRLSFSVQILNWVTDRVTKIESVTGSLGVVATPKNLGFTPPTIASLKADGASGVLPAIRAIARHIR